MEDFIQVTNPLPLDCLVSPLSTFIRIACGDKIGVEPYGPVMPEPPIFEKNNAFREYFLTKSNAYPPPFLLPSLFIVDSSALS